MHERMGVELLVAGVTALMLGEALLLRGIFRLARPLGLPSRVSTLTLAALAAGSPEIAVAVQASRDGLSEVALGSVIGSSIFNLLFLMGSVALAAPLVAAPTVRRAVGGTVGVALLLFALGQDGAIARWEGITLLVLLTLLLLGARRAGASAAVEFGRGAAEEPRGWRNSDSVWMLAGAGLLVVGAVWMVQGVVGSAALFGVSGQAIALTLVGSTTSLPEITLALQAAIRGTPEIAVGIILGSSLIGLLAGVGLASVGAPGGIEFSTPLLSFELAVLIAAAAAAALLLRSGGLQSHEGVFFLVTYLGYVPIRLWMDARPEVLAPFGGATLLLVILLAGPALAVVLRRLPHVRSTHRDPPGMLQPRRKHGSA